MSRPDPDASAFIEQVRQNHAGLRAFVRSLGVDPLWVDDVAQEAFVVAYQRLDEFDDERDFGAWVRGIARNLVLNERRKSARRKRLLSEHLTDVLLSTTSIQETEDPGLSDRGQARLDALRVCIGKVPEKSRALLQARYEENASAAEIGENLGMRSAAVRKSLERLRERLRKCMEEELLTAPA